MSDDKIKTVYVCQICYAKYDTKEEAEQCVKSHESDRICRRIELGHTLGCTRYDFFSCAFRIDADYNLKTKVDTYGLYDGFPKFATECLDNGFDILAAKKRLIEAAHEWADKYKDVLAGLERELEAEND